jgi:hypothetical protein
MEKGTPFDNGRTDSVFAAGMLTQWFNGDITQLLSRKQS